MFFEVPFTNEMSQCVLFKSRNSTGIERKLFMKDLYQMHGKNHIADTNGGGQCFGECVDVNDLFQDVNALEHGEMVRWRDMHNLSLKPLQFLNFIPFSHIAAWLSLT